MDTKELLIYGLSVFNGEEDKFQRWFNKNNYSIGGIPAELCKTDGGIKIVKEALNRIEYGNF